MYTGLMHNLLFVMFAQVSHAFWCFEHFVAQVLCEMFFYVHLHRSHAQLCFWGCFVAQVSAEELYVKGASH